MAGWLTGWMYSCTDWLAGGPNPNFLCKPTTDARAATLVVALTSHYVSRLSTMLIKIVQFGISLAVVGGLSGADAPFASTATVSNV